MRLPPNGSYLIWKLLSKSKTLPDVPHDFQAANDPELFKRWLETCNSPHLLISAEDLSAITLADWQALRAYFQPFMDAETVVRVLIFARHPVDLASSMRNQIEKKGPSNRGIRAFTNALSRYEKLPELLSAAWGDPLSIEWHSYEEAKSAGLWPYFVRLMGLNPQDFPMTEHLEANVSVPFESRRIFHHFAEDEHRDLLSKIRKIESGTEDGLTEEEAQEVWSIAGERMNNLLVNVGLPSYEPVAGRFNLTSPDLWPSEYLAEWKRIWSELTPEQRASVVAAFEGLRKEESGAWHPKARSRFESLRLWMLDAPPKRDKWRTAWRIVMAVAKDAALGRRNWPATRMALPATSPKVHKRGGAPKVVNPENWPIPPRKNWKREPFSAEHFPQLRILSFHNPKTAGTAFARCLQASSLGDGVCFLSGVNFESLLTEVLKLPREEAGWTSPFSRS